MMRALQKLTKKLAEVQLPAVPRLSRVKMTWLLVGGALVVVAVLTMLSLNHSFPLLQTRGEIANRQRDLLLFATGLAVIVLVPVYVMLFTFAWRYRAGHKKDYKPNWDSHKGYETLWWGVPLAIIVVLAAVTWVTSHSLDPFKPLSSTQKPLQVQVVALQWKWLFIYPEEKIASVGEVAFPVGRPVEFTMTSDAPMNSFWIPQLAGQIYVMSGMSTKLHVSADSVGTYAGLSANISGKGFADMRFNARAMSTTDYDAWVAGVKGSGKKLNQQTYEVLARPGKSATLHYLLEETKLYDRVIMKYMTEHGTTQTAENETKPSEEKASSPVKPTHDMPMMQSEGMH
ncbi:ubiquinol oxidase subunit II [Candidatus Saccharibacteria bacterium]|nr:MAG: ubiquinol oxidase subunit II [Candidatus Saccharibacteria bacterium]